MNETEIIEGEGGILPASPPPSGPRLLKRREVERLCALSTAGLYREIREGTFPKQVRVRGGVAWVDREVFQWIEGRIAARDAGMKRPPGRPRKNPFLQSTVA